MTMNKMSLAERVNEDACGRDPSLYDVNVPYFLPSDGGDSDDEENARSFDFDTGSWLYKEDDLRINQRLIILQECLNRMYAKNNFKDQGLGKENKGRSNQLSHTGNKETASEGALACKGHTQSERSLGKLTPSDNVRIFRSNSIRSVNNDEQAALSETNSSALTDQVSEGSSLFYNNKNIYIDIASAVTRLEDPLSLPDLIQEIPMSAVLTEDDTELVQLALSSLKFREKLFNTAQVYKHADTSEPGSESLKNLFHFLLKNLPPQNTQDQKQLSKLFVCMNKFEKEVLDKTVNFQSIFKLYETMTASREHSKIDDTKMKQLTKELQVTLLELSNEGDLPEEETITAIKRIHEFMSLMKHSFHTFFDVNFQVTHIETLLTLKIGNEQNMLEEAVDFLQESFQGFAKLLRSYDTSFEEMEASVRKKLKNLKAKKNDDTFTVELDRAITQLHFEAKQSLCTYFRVQYVQEYPRQEELSDSSSINSSNTNEPPEKVVSYEDKKIKDRQRFERRIGDLFEKLLSSDSFLLTEYDSANGELLLEFYMLYKDNAEHKTKNADQVLTNQLQRKNICTAEIEFLFDGITQISIPLYEPNTSVLNYTMLELGTREYLDDITSSSALKHALSHKIPLYHFSSDLHHSEKTAIGFVEENAETIVQDLLTKLGDNKESLKKLTHISLNLHSLKNICETCTILLSHKLINLFMTLYTELKKHLDLEEVPEEAQKMTKRVGSTSSPHKVPRLQGAEASLLVKEDQMSFLNYEFLKRSLLLTQDTLKSYQAKRTYFVSAPSTDHPHALEFYLEQVWPLEIAAAKKINEKKEEKESEK